MFVGDLILAVRELMPDMPLSTTPPIPVVSVNQTTTARGNFSAGNTVWLVVTGITQYGETLPSIEYSIAITGGNNAVAIQVGVWPQVTTIRVYYTSGATAGPSLAGLEAVYEQFAVTGSTTVTIQNLFQVGFPPVRSSAWLPDGDGGFASAATIYRWMNEAFKTIAVAAGGIQDVCPIASVSGQRRYVAPGQWLKFDSAFYDGWELDMGSKGDVFYNRNLTANISISVMADAQSNTTRIELYWTPSRTSGTTTTTAALNQADTTVSINAATGWLLQDGFAQVASEILSYSAITATQLQNCIRAWSGTLAPTAVAAPATVTELNIMLFGYRMPYVYSVGQSALTLDCPPGWEPFLKDYILGCARKAEQETEEGKALQKQATDGVTAWVKSNKPIAGPRQCRIWDDRGIRGVVPGGLTGGIIIP